MKDKTDYCLLGDVARALGCPPYRIVYLLTTGQVPEPRRLGNRRLFRQEDVQRIAVRLGIKQQAGGGARMSTEFRTMKEIGAAFGVSSHGGRANPTPPATDQ